MNEKEKKRALVHKPTTAEKDRIFALYQKGYTTREIVVLMGEDKFNDRKVAKHMPPSVRAKKRCQNMVK